MSTLAERTLVLHAVPLDGETATVTDHVTGRTIRERFGGPFVFAGVQPADVLVRFDHGIRSVGRLTKITPTRRTLVAHATITDDMVWSLYRSGGLRGVSIGFAPVVSRDTHDEHGPVVERLKVRLGEVSLVDEPAYRSARVVGTLADLERKRAEQRRWLDRQVRAAGLTPRPGPARERAARQPSRAAPAAGGGIRHTAPTGFIVSVR